ncbi:hypothetical protein PLICRDRAFT_107645 [Plicaturopsis crispa FD-325 SS-3]|nr:hypothetical protein PLICRDRAFT_107645 [Plicaturopsis crispa FD-325 SS-3]
MDKYSANHYQSYSWHQATVLLLLPYDTAEDDTVVTIERNYLIAGVRNQTPHIKGQLYGNVDVSSSTWQLEPRHSRLSARERTTSTTSTTSTRSSYAFVSDPEISSSFAASLESGHTSDVEEPITPSPAHSSPNSLPADERGYVFHNRRLTLTNSGPGSPGLPPHSLTSSFSSLESLHSAHSGRLLTLHLEKEQSVIWPSLIVGPVPEALSPYVPSPIIHDVNTEHKYNMDPTSLVLTALEIFDIRRDKEEAFEYFIRAWHHSHMPASTMRLVTYYLPLHASYDLPVPSEEPAPRGTSAWYFQMIGGAEGLAQLYLEAGLMHLEGAASSLLSPSYSSLLSIRLPQQPPPGELGTETWLRDREVASQYFDRARTLQPSLDVPLLPSEDDDSSSQPEEVELEMPSIEITQYSKEARPADADATLVRRRRKKEELDMLNELRAAEDMDNSWYLYIPGLVGAGTALLVVGVVGALSLTNWRRSQGS